MRLYIKGDYIKKIPYGYLELAGKMWFPEEKQVSYSNAGDNEQLQEDFSVNLSLRKSTADKRWSSVPLKEGVRSLFSHIEECIEKFGLRLRSVGEHPQAADTLGINVYRMRYLGVMISGALAGIGGAIYAQSVSVNFAVTTIVGPGFIALAAMIFGKWNPIGAMLASLFFGASQSLAVSGNQLPLLKGIPSIYLQIAPYVLTMVVLAAFFGQAVAPKADGVNYIKSK